jgi:HAMP domain-containing protein
MGLCERKLQRLAHEGKIPGQYRKGKRWRVRSSAYEHSPLGELGTRGNLKRLEKAVGKSLESNELKQSFRKTAQSINSAMASPLMAAAEIWALRAAHEIGCARGELRLHMSESDELKLDMPLIQGIRSGALVQKDIAALLERKRVLLGLIRDALKARAEQKGRRTQRERSVGLMGLIAKHRGISRSNLYRELESIVPKGRRPMGWILGVLEEMDKWSETAGEAEELVYSGEHAASPAEGLEDLAESFGSFSIHR